MNGALKWNFASWEGVLFVTLFTDLSIYLFIYIHNKFLGNNTQNSTLGNYTLTANVTPLHHSLITTPSEEYYK